MTCPRGFVVPGDHLVAGRRPVNLPGAALHSTGDDERVFKISVESVVTPASALPADLPATGRTASFTVKK
ncbi:MAG: hypothetical protein LBF09_06515 [Odoribacteraceae bacterium]|jgi:hypothetical protein|nr:hypothetical protein [Odoribacteraceae bacterium]